MALSACESTGTGNVETAAPYETERTASHGNMPMERTQTTERSFRATQSK
ncbi:MAG: hypothetical protein ACT4OY_07770 [Alphaproteobacteria bacterium]